MAKNVELDAEAKAMLKMFNDMDGFFDDMAEEMAKMLVGKSRFFNKSNKAAALILEHFNKSSTGRQKTFPPLAPSTLAQKKGSKMLVESGGLKGSTISSARGRRKGNDIFIKASVPKYGKLNNEGAKPRLPKREFFAVNADGKLPAEEKAFSKSSNTLLQGIMFQKGVKSRRR